MKLFSQVKGNYPKRTGFDLSHDKKLSCKIGQLIPILVDEVVPGDTFSVNSEVMVRLAPMLAPVMHRMNVYVHYFYVPNRIIWSDWKDFITGQDEIDKNPKNIPTFSTSNQLATRSGSLSDYLGIPTDIDLSKNPISQLPFRAYYKIWDEYYRDQNQQTETNYGTWSSGAGYALWSNIKERAWEKDYFTSALPWAQKTPEGLPVGIPVDLNYTQPGSLAFHSDGTPADGPLQVTNSSITDGTESVTIKNFVDGEELDISLNDFRYAHRLQKWFERQARSGSRYVETMLSHYGQKIPDLYDRPEFLGGGKTPVVMSEVMNTNANQSGDQGATNMPLGDMAGHGIAVGRMNKTTAKFKEHGWLMGIMSVIPKTTYQDGIHKMFSRKDKFDFYWPEFANLGEQPILNKELWISADDTTNDDIFGYQSIYSEYKYKSSGVHGDMRNDLNYWHMGRKFYGDKDYYLNEDFIKCDHTEVSRIFAVPTQQNPDKDYQNKDHLWVHVYNDVKAYRPMPYYGTPTL